MTQGITTRPSTTTDAPLLLAIFIEAKAAELASLGLSTEQLQPMLEMQYRGRDLTYGQTYANLSETILCLHDGTSVGRLLVDRQPDCYRVIDLTVLTELRGQGIATQSLKEVQQAAEQESLPVRLQVSRNSPAQRLYQRLGFAVIAANELSLEMEWRASKPASSDLRNSRIPNAIASLSILVTCLLVFAYSARGQAILTVTPGATAGTIAGRGTIGYSGDSGAATGATFASPSAVAYDASGDLFIADTDNNVIREVSASGVVTTIAGNGQQGYSGDGGAATSAELNAPTGIAVDASGNLYVADSGNNRIREVSGGTITTIAGTGVAGYSGDGSAAISAELDLPSAVAVDGSGNLYIADTDNNVIREIKSGIITTVAGNGQQGYSGDGGAATSASLDTPSGVAVDASGNIFIADTHNQRIREVSGGTITTVAGSGPITFSGGYSGDGGSATSALLARPTGIAFDAAGNIYIADTNNNRLRKVGNGSIDTVEGSGAQGFGGDGGTATSAVLNNPSDAAINSSGGVAITDMLNERIRGVNLPTLTFASQGVGVTSSAQDVTIANSGSGTLTVQSVNITGSFAIASGGTCSALPITLNGGQSCTEAIAFQPAAPGSFQGSVLVGGSGVVSQTILLNGVATQTTPSITLQSSSAAVFLDNSFTLTAVVSSGRITPTGTVTFLDGTAAIGSAPLNAGMATIIVSTLAEGTHSITAVYSGSLAFTSVTSTAVSEQVEDFSLNFSGGIIPTIQVIPGETAAVKLVISPVGSTTFPAAIKLSANGLPSGAVATFSPATIASGAGTTNVTLNVKFPGTSAMLVAPGIGRGPSPLYLGLLILPFAGFRRRWMRSAPELRSGVRKHGLWLLLLLIVTSLAAITGISGCGSSGGFNGQKPQTYTLTVTGTSGTLSHSATVQLTVE